MLICLFSTKQVSIVKSIWNQHLWDEESRLQSGPGFAPTNLRFSMPQSFRNTGQFVSVFSTWSSPGKEQKFWQLIEYQKLWTSRACPWVRLFLLCQIYLLSEQVGGSSAVFCVCELANRESCLILLAMAGMRPPSCHGHMSQSHGDSAEIMEMLTMCQCVMIFGSLQHSDCNKSLFETHQPYTH